MKLSIPFSWGGRTWVEVDYGKPSAEVMADAREAADTGDYFQTMLVFLAGTVKSITDEAGGTETDKAQLRNVLKEMPAGNADHLCLYILAQKGNDAIEGYYECPRCGKPIVCEGEHADSVFNLEVRQSEKDPQVEITLSNAVSITNKATDEVIMEMASLTIRHPTLRDYIGAFAASGKDRIRQQYIAYANALVKVNDRPVDDEFRRKYGWALGKMDADDMNEIARQLLEVGLQRTVKKVCGNCGKRFDAVVSTSGFFGSALEGRSAGHPESKDSGSRPASKTSTSRGRKS